MNRSNKNVAGGAAAGAPNSSSRTQPKAAASSALNLDRILQVSVLQHDAAMFFELVKSVVPDVESFKGPWLSDQVDGPSLLSVGPQNFHSTLKASFPDMNAGLRSKIFSCVQKRIVEEVHSRLISNQAVADLWNSSIQPQNLFNVQNASNAQNPPLFREVVVGQSQHAYFRSPSQHGLPSASAVSGHFQPQSPYHDGQVARPASAVVFQSPPPPIRSAGNVPASAVAPGAGVGAPPPIQHNLSVDVLLDQQFAASKALFQNQGLSMNVAVKLPWVQKAEQKAQYLQDPSMPFGFDRVCVHDKIEKAVADRLVKGQLGVVRDTKQVKWPVWSEFNKPGFIEARLQFYECVLASMSSAIFKDFKDCLDGVARQAACATYQLSDNDFSELPDRVFYEYCEIEFGPKNASQALQNLTDVRVAAHRDRNHSQADFLQKFDSVCHKFLLAVNGIMRCHMYWRQDEDTLVSCFDHKTIMKKWEAVFPHQTVGNPQSVQIVIVRDFIKLNNKMAFREQVRRLRVSFAAQDRKVLENECKYTTSPTEGDSGAVSSSAHGGQSFRGSSNPNRGSSNPIRDSSNPNRGSSNATRGPSKPKTRPPSDATCFQRHYSKVSSRNSETECAWPSPLCCLWKSSQPFRSRFWTEHLPDLWNRTCQETRLCLEEYYRGKERSSAHRLLEISPCRQPQNQAKLGQRIGKEDCSCRRPCSRGRRCRR
jgi:hypothetical protein